MPTAKEYRFEAKACLELAERTKEPYVKVALIELARDYNRAACQAERGEDALRNLSSDNG
jgi:hypothetical protein